MIFKIIIWVIGVLLIVVNFGFEIGPIIASLGIGGIAVAFALQNILKDIFSSFSIYFDKPFQIGDKVKIGGETGIVKKISLKSTKIKLVQGEELSIPNGKITNDFVYNVTKRKEIRKIIHFGVSYNTSYEKLKDINNIIENIFKSLGNIVSLSRIHLKEFKEYSINYELVFYVNSSNYNIYMDLSQKIHLEIIKLFHHNEIDLAFPIKLLKSN